MPEPEIKSDREMLLLTAQTLDNVCSKITNIDSRLVDLEKWRYLITGGMLVIIFIVGLWPLIFRIIGG